MKKWKIALSGFMIIIPMVISLNSCNKNDNPVNPEESLDLEDLQIPAGFTWQTSESIEFSIKKDNAAVISITSEDGSILYHKGFYNVIEDRYKVSIPLPDYVTTVLVNGRPVSITGDKINVDLVQKNHSFLKNTSQGNGAANITEGLVSLWHFDENTGTTVLDAEGTNDGAFSGAERVNGISEGALNFDGEGGHVEIPNSSTLNLIGDKISISLWFKMDFVGDDGGFMFSRTKYIMRVDGHGKITFALYNPGWSSVVLDWDDRIIDTDWHHLVGTYDGNSVKMFVDGELKTETSTSGNLQSNTSNIHIGNQGNTNDFAGTIDEVAYYDRSLTDAEVLEIYNTIPNSGNGEENLISYWDFNENSGSTLEDKTGENDATIIDGTWDEGLSGGGLFFDGEDDFARKEDPMNLNFTDEVTIMAWAKAEENKTAKIAQKGDWDGYGIGIDLWRGWKGGIRLDNNTGESLDWENGRPVLGEWYHIALAYNGSTLVLYVNGQLKNSKAVSGLLHVNSRNLAIGSDDGGQKFFKGTIDEVKMFNVGLDQTTIQSIFNNSGTGPDSDGDGVPDDEDDYPDDPARAFNNYFPSAGYGSLAFEDLWPGKGDYDFNDLVIDYRFKSVTAASNNLTEIYGYFIVRAIGAGYANGFGYQLPGEELETSDITVTGYDLQEDIITLNENGMEQNQDKVTIMVFDNATNILEPSAGFGVNVEPGAPYVEPDTLTITMAFEPETYTLEQSGLIDFNPFLFIDGERGKEIHLLDFEPTSLADEAYFGTLHDVSDLETGDYYKTENNLPWALNITEKYAYTIEKAQINAAHLKFAEWAISGGNSYPDWYKDEPGYRNESNIYPEP